MSTLLAVTVAMSTQAHESKHKLEAPGFRPPTEQADAFIQNVESSKIAVFPSIVRAVNPADEKVSQWHSKVALERIVEFLGENGLGTAEIVDTKFKIGEAPKGGQFALFNQTIENIGKQLGSYTGDADYIMVLDIIRVRTKAWGLQCYILDREGNNAFSFLLNSHHKPFVDAAIEMQAGSKESGKKLVADCTELLLEMLHQQVQTERDIAAYKPDPSIVGKYIGKEDPANNYVVLRMDGSFEGRNHGTPAAGTFTVVEGSTLILVMPEGNIPVGRFESGRLVTIDDSTWSKSEGGCSQEKKKAAVIEGFPEATITIIPGSQNFSGPVDKHRRFYELGKGMFRKEAEGNAVLLGLLLEEKGYDKYEISDPEFWFSEEEDARKNRAATFGGFVSKLELKTDYALGTEFVFHIEEGIQEVYTVFVDAKGKVVWEDSRKCDETTYDNIDLRTTPERLVLATMVTTRLTPVMGLGALPSKALAPEKKKVLEDMRAGKSGGSCPMQ